MTEVRERTSRAIANRRMEELPRSRLRRRTDSRRVRECINGTNRSGGSYRMKRHPRRRIEKLFDRSHTVSCKTQNWEETSATLQGHRPQKGADRNDPPPSVPRPESAYGCMSAHARSVKSLARRTETELISSRSSPTLRLV